MLVRELIKRLESLKEIEGDNAEVYLVEVGGDRYGFGVSLVSGKIAKDSTPWVKYDARKNSKELSENDQLIHGYFGGKVSLW